MKYSTFNELIKLDNNKNIYTTAYLIVYFK